MTDHRRPAVRTARAAATAAPWFGRPWEHRQAAIAGVGSFAACSVYCAAADRWAPELAPSWIEFIGTATSLWSVWITQRRNVLALPVGIVSVVLDGLVLRTTSASSGRRGSSGATTCPVQFWAWAHWTRGGDGQTELTVTRLRWTSDGLAVLVAGVVAATLVLGLAARRRLGRRPLHVLGRVDRRRRRSWRCC